jgi:hypothetical protein
MAGVFIATALPRLAASTYISKKRTQNMDNAIDISHIVISTSMAITAGYIYFFGINKFLYPLPLAAAILEWLPVIDHQNHVYYTIFEIVFTVTFILYYLVEYCLKNKLLYLVILGLFSVIPMIYLFYYLHYFDSDYRDIAVNIVNSLSIHTFISFLVV